MRLPRQCLRMFLAPTAIAVALAALPSAAPAQTLEEVETQLQAALDKLKSFSAKRIEKSNVEYSGMSQMAEREGTWEWVRGAENDLLRIELKGKFKTNISGASSGGDSAHLEVWDGQHYSRFQDLGGVKVAEKGGINYAARRKITEFAVLGMDGAKLLPAEKIDGADCIVVEVPMQEDAPNAVKARHYFRKDCGLKVRTVAFDAADKEVVLYELKDLKLDAEIKPDRFVFKAPEGVTVTDSTSP